MTDATVNQFSEELFKMKQEIEKLKRAKKLEKYKEKIVTKRLLISISWFMF
jgi:hypothetical protein